MFYKNNFPSNKTIKNNIKLLDFKEGFDYDNLVSKGKLSSKLLYNFHYENGALTSGYGIRDIMLARKENSTDFSRALVNEHGVKFLGAWLFNYYNNEYEVFQRKVVLYGDDKKIYYFRLFGADDLIYILYNFTLNSLPEGLHYNINNQDLLLLTSKDDNMLVWNNNEPYVVSDVPKFRSMCIYSSRLFAIVEGPGNKIWFSDNTDPTSWPAVKDESIGVIEFPDAQRGRPNKILSFLDDIYVIREFGISRITFFSKTNTYQISQLFAGSGRIFPETVCVCDNKIYMTTSDGFYCFDGDSATKLDIKINGLLSPLNQNSRGAFFDGKYFVACKLDFNDNKQIFEEEREDCINNALVAIDVETNTCTITRGVDIAWLLPITEGYFSKMLVCLNGENGSRVCELTKDGLYFERIMPKFWSMQINDLNSLEKEKLIKQIYIDSRYDCKVLVDCDGIKKEFKVIGGNKINRLNIMQKTKKISLTLESEESLNEIKSIEIVYGLTK